MHTECITPQQYLQTVEKSDIATNGTPTCADIHAEVRPFDAAAALWQEMDAEDRLAMVLSFQNPTDWATPEALDTLAYFRHIPQEWLRITETYKGIRGSAFNLEKAIDALLDAEHKAAPTPAATPERARDTPAAPAATGEHAWHTDLIVTSKGELRPILHNAICILRHHPDWHRVFALDTLAARVVVRARPPYAPTETPWEPRPVEDYDDSCTAVWLQQYGLLVSSRVAAEAIQTVAYTNQYNPLQDYLNGLQWDGTSRIDTWLETYCAAANPEGMDTAQTQYLRAVSAKTLIGAVARALHPGCRADSMTVLEGKQGLKKSTAWRVVCGGPWFLDGIGDIVKKDALEALLGKWIVEFPELSALSRVEVEQVKHFLSKCEDEFRLPYGRRSTKHPRSVLFVGSTNAGDWLKDATGNRRFWPVHVYGPCDIDTLATDRDQLWAEAVSRYRQGETWWLDDATEQIAYAEQGARLEQDDWEAPVLAWLHTHGQLGVYATFMQKLSLTYYTPNHAFPLSEPSREKL